MTVVLKTMTFAESVTVTTTLASVEAVPEKIRVVSFVRRSDALLPVSLSIPIIATFTAPAAMTSSLLLVSLIEFPALSVIVAVTS